LRVLDPVDLAVSVAAPVGPQPSQPLTLDITVLNYGPSLASGVQLVDTLPAGVTFDSASPGCIEASGVVTCDIGDLGAGASTALTITLTPTGLGAFENTSVVSSSATEIYEANNTVVRTVIVGGHTIYLPLVFK
jgi:uncharacterized repeat protein (TIGR01451 family)